MAMESLQSLWESDDELPDFNDGDDEPQCAPSAPPASAQAPAEDPLEDGEIGPAFGTPHTASSFQFKANDLDAAVQRAKNRKKAKKREKRKVRNAGRRKQSDHKKVQEMDPKVFVARTARYLKEPKRYLIEAAVARLGMDSVRDLLHEVETIEENGGQMIASGERRRTPGGVLWNVIKSRYEEDYNAIMAAGRSFEKQQRQEKQQIHQKRKVEVNDMLIDGQPSKRRRRKGVTEVGTALPAAQVKRTRVTIWPSRTQIGYIQHKVDPENSGSVKQVQSAWAEGVKEGRHLAGLTDEEMLDDAMNKKPVSIAERLRVPIQYDDL